VHVRVHDPAVQHGFGCADLALWRAVDTTANRPDGIEWDVPDHDDMIVGRTRPGAQLTAHAAITRTVANQIQRLPSHIRENHSALVISDPV
jgi:hypothetical protein